jgi:signal transduction histidine kinase
MPSPPRNAYAPLTRFISRVLLSSRHAFFVGFMQLLPIPTADGSMACLPLSDPAAHAVAAVWLEDDPNRRLAAAATLLRHDPALVLWSMACREWSAQHRGYEHSPGSLSVPAERSVPEWDQLVSWLVDGAPDFLHSTPLPALTDEHRQLWSVTDARLEDWLVRLAGRLVRLRELEELFQRQLTEAKLRALKEFAYGASHEINNPLANISTRAQTLLLDERDPERRRQLATIHTQAIRAHEMISNVMHFAHPPRLNVEPVDLGLLLREVRDELAELAAEQETAIEISLPDRLSEVVADVNQLTVALKNIVQNSLEALAHAGRVHIEVEESSDGWLTIRVTDDGPGIPAEVRPHLFDPFYSGREAGRGLGLGLSKAWRIITMHGGRIDLAETEQGTTFVLRLPGVRGEKLEARS